MKKACLTVILPFFSASVLAVEDCYQWGAIEWYQDYPTAKPARDSAKNGVGQGDCPPCPWTNAVSSYASGAGRNNARYQSFQVQTAYSAGACSSAEWGYTASSLARL